MKAWQDALIAPDADIREALKVIDRTGAGIALVVDAERRLIGTLSDGDIRRALIRGAALEDPCVGPSHRDPLTAGPELDRGGVLGLLRSQKLRQLPIVDADRRVVGLATLADYLDIPERPHGVIIMAGGRGTRLAELTRTTPKPMLHIGPRPILETIVQNFADQGFRNIFLAVNYKAEQIEAHFGDGSDRGLNIRYLHETRPLGTCGALSLLPDDRPEGPIIVTNGDVLSKEDYGFVMDRHLASGADGSMLVREYEMQVPFGVVDQADGAVRSIREKPTQRFTINGGVYVLSPRAVSLVPHDVFFDMPQLLQKMLESGLPLRTHAADSYWVDIGRMADFEKANAEFSQTFG
ncbi:CBS domain-containing protein [Rhizobium sp. CRIBSB]|nr:CBS domain-containing protein [Rhizobium sp. CRIBSB]